MAYGLKYQGQIETAWDHSVTVELLEEDYGGAETSIHLTDNPVDLVWGRKGADIYTPILASHFKTSVWRTLGTTILREVAGADEKQFQVKVGKGGSPYWTGYLVTDAYQEDTMGEPSLVEIHAVDGLGLLKDVPFYTTDTVDGEEVPVAWQTYAPVTTILKDALLKTGLDLPFSTAMGWYPHASAGFSGDPLSKILINRKVFYDEEWDAMPTYDVLRQLCLAFGAQLFQRGNEWHFVQRELLVGGAEYTRYRYDADGVAQGTVTAGGEVSTADKRRLSGNAIFDKGYGRASVQYNHGPIPSLLDGGDFTPRPGQERSTDPSETPEGGDSRHRGQPGDPDPHARYWDLIAGIDRATGQHAKIMRSTEPLVMARGAVVGRTTGRTTGRGGGARRGSSYTPRQGTGTQQATVEWVLGLQSFFHGSSLSPDDVLNIVVDEGPRAEQDGFRAEEGQVLTFRAEVTIPHLEGEGAGLFTTYFLVRVGDHWLRRDGVWEPAATVNHFVPPGNTWADRGLELDATQPIQIISEPHPEGGEVFAQLFSTSDTTGSDLDPWGVQWDNVALLITDVEGEVLEARYYEANLGLEGQERDTVDLYIGDGPAHHVVGALKWDDGSADLFDCPMTDGWQRTPYGAGDASSEMDLGYLLADTYLRAQAGALPRITETYKLLGYEMGMALEREGEYYAPVWFREGLLHGDEEGEWVLLALDGLLTEFHDEARQNSAFTPLGGGTTGLGDTMSGLLALYLAQHNPLAITSGEHPTGPVAEIEVEQREGAALAEGDIVVIVNAATGRPIRAQVTSNEPEAGFTRLPVGQEGNPETDLNLQEALAAGSGIYFGHRELILWIRALEAALGEIEDRVEVVEEEEDGEGGLSDVFGLLRGTATVASGETSVTVDTGSDISFDAEDVQISPLGSVPEEAWLENHGVGVFDIALGSAAGGDRSFVWWAIGAAGNQPPYWDEEEDTEISIEGEGDGDGGGGEEPVEQQEVFTADGTWDWSAAGEPDTVDVLVVGGGGGGGSRQGGGGGAGGVLWETGVAVDADVAVTVGAGGAGGTSGGRGSDGEDSAFGAQVAQGGGGGGGRTSDNQGADGGSGGGGANNASGGTGTSGQGNDGGASSWEALGGGGGGAGAAGESTTGSTNENGGAGGAGVDMAAQVGTSVGDGGWFGGGGGGGAVEANGADARAAGGQGGGGSGAYDAADPDGEDGMAGTGGGGGGCRAGTDTAGNGGSGVVIVKWTS